MSKIAIIIPYFGKIPSNIVTFLQSCGNNSKLDWLIFTDLNFRNLKIPKNVHIIKKDFPELKKHIYETINLKGMVLDTPYKLCDYKPAYGDIFKDYIKNYDYWGYSDVDVVYGNIWKFINNGIEGRYDKIGHCGHFTLFKNTFKVNSRYKLPINKNYLYKRVFKTPSVCHFDEDWGINLIYQYYHIKTYDNINLVNEPFPENMVLTSIDKRFKNKRQVYTYLNGKCLFFYQDDSKIYKKEFGYFHFQKRLFYDFLYNTYESFYIDYSGYHIIRKFNMKIIKSLINEKLPLIKRLHYMEYAYVKTNWFTDREIWGIHLPIKHILDRIFKEKNFFI